MSATVPVDLTEAMIMTALRNVLLALLPRGTEVVMAQANRVAEPAGQDFVMVTPVLRKRLATNLSAWHDGSFDAPQAPGTRTDMQSTQVTVQLDIHGPGSGDNTQVVTTMFRSETAFDAFAASGCAVQALYADEARQAPFLNAEQQVESRWTIDVRLEAGPAVTSPQQFAAALYVGLDGIQ